MESLFVAGAALLLSAAFASDVRTMTIPNRLTVPATAAGLVCHAVPGIGSGLAFALAGGALGFAMVFVMYLFRAVGAGDVKLFAALGAWIGAGEVVDTAIYAILFAGICGAAILIARKVLAAKRMPEHFPFMIAVVPGALAAWWA